MGMLDFLDVMNSEAFDNERKQILLRIERILIPTLNENNKNEAKVIEQKSNFFSFKIRSSIK